MKGGYESMVWIKDKDGREYACYADDIKKDGKNKREENDFSQCLDVNQMIGTERW